MSVSVYDYPNYFKRMVMKTIQGCCPECQAPILELLEGEIDGDLSAYLFPIIETPEELCEDAHTTNEELLELWQQRIPSTFEKLMTELDELDEFYELMESIDEAVCVQRWLKGELAHSDHRRLTEDEARATNNKPSGLGNWPALWAQQGLKNVFNAHYLITHERLWAPACG